MVDSRFAFCVGGGEMSSITSDGVKICAYDLFHVIHGVYVMIRC